MAIERPIKPSVDIPQKTENYSSWQRPEEDIKKDNLERKIKFISELAVNSPSSHNTQPWVFHVDAKKSSIMLLSDPERQLTESDPDGRELYLSLGCALGTMEVVAHYLGCSVNIEFKTNQNSTYATLKFSEGHKATKEDNDLFESIFKRVNYDGNHLSNTLSPQAVKEIEKVFEGIEGVEFKFIEDSKTKDEIAQLVEIGDRIIFNNKSFAGELAKWLRDAATRRKDGLLTSVLGLPSELRRYAARIILTANGEAINSLAKTDKDKIKASAAIGVIAAKKESPRILMEIGKLYQIASLKAAKEGIYFGARAVLIETGELHKDLSNKLKLTSRPEMMFRAGYPSDTRLEHTPRFKSSEKKVIIQGKDKFKVVSCDHPAYFSLSKDYDLRELIYDLGEGVQVLSKSYTEHWLPDLFSVRNPSLSTNSPDYLEKLKKFIAENNHESDGIWIYNPHEKTLEHLPNEGDFYAIITASNSRLITEEGQRRIRNLYVGVAGLSGSGAEATRAIAMSGIKHLKLADFDFVSPRNKNRMQGTTGENKAWVLALELWKHNPFLDLEIYYEGINEANVEEFEKGLDLTVEQTDSSSKFRIRQCSTGIVVMVTDFDDPKIDVEEKGEPFFGGRADMVGIDIDYMEKIKSLAQSTGPLATLMGPDDVPERNYQNFIDILNGKSNSYSQTFIGSQSGGGALGRFFVAFAEGNFDKSQKSWVVKTLPSSDSKKRDMKKTFFEEYNRQFGKI